MHQDNARPYLLLNHYTELLDAKGIALMAGDLDENVTVIDAQMLANQVQMFYLGSDDMLQLVEDFNKRWASPPFPIPRPVRMHACSPLRSVVPAPAGRGLLGLFPTMGSFQSRRLRFGH